jgi:hypothetical protein
MGVLISPLLRLVIVAGFSIVGALGQAEAQIRGQTSGGTASADAVNPHPMSRDDRDVTTTIAIEPLITSSLITEAARNFKLITKSTALDNLKHSPGQFGVRGGGRRRDELRADRGDRL